MERTKNPLELQCRCCFFIYLLGALIMFTVSDTKGCKVMVFKVDIQDKALENHVFKTEMACDDFQCRVFCFLDDHCISYNFGMSRNNETRICELNDSDHIMHPEDLVDRLNTTYKSAQNNCNCSKHSTCRYNFAQETHRCECKPGFTGHSCENNIDECASNPCQNGGSCQEQVNSYNCACAAGFTGVNCETDIDDCASNPCQNGGSCHDRVNSYNCICAAGFTGAHCQTDIDDCVGFPCLHGGVCHDYINSYDCICVVGYEGPNCQTNIDECASNPCQNGGVCQDRVNSYNCTCAAGFTGVNCQTDIDECASNPCQNGGSCQDQVNSYNCTCAAGFTGVNCQTDIDDCTSNPCQNGGSCQDHVNAYNCTCAAGFTGVNCQTDIDDCASNPCQNGGSCQDHVNSYNCKCAPGFTGADCQTEWLDASPIKVCIGAKDDNFAKVIVPLEGYVKAMKLVYDSGDGLSYAGDTKKGYWGGTHLGPSTLQIFITYVNNSILVPQNVHINEVMMSYTFPGVTNMDPVLEFPYFVPPFFVQKNQSLRAWFGPDLKNSMEWDNYGTTCFEIKIMYL